MKLSICTKEHWEKLKLFRLELLLQNVIEQSNAGSCFPAFRDLSVCSGTQVSEMKIACGWELKQHIFIPVLVRFKLGLKSF